MDMSGMQKKEIVRLLFLIDKTAMAAPRRLAFYTCIIWPFS